MVEKKRNRVLERRHGSLASNSNVDAGGSHLRLNANSQLSGVQGQSIAPSMVYLQRNHHQRCPAATDDETPKDLTLDTLNAFSSIGRRHLKVRAWRTSPPSVLSRQKSIPEKTQYLQNRHPEIYRPSTDFHSETPPRLRRDGSPRCQTHNYAVKLLKGPTLHATPSPTNSPLLQRSLRSNTERFKISSTQRSTHMESRKQRCGKQNKKKWKGDWRQRREPPTHVKSFQGS